MGDVMQQTLTALQGLLSIYIAVLQGLLTPVIGSIAVYIAWQQWKVNERKYKLDLYAKRLRVYEATVEFLWLVLRDFRPAPLEIGKFRGATAEADFLFDADIRDYLNEVTKRALESNVAHNEYRDMTQELPPGYDHKKVVDEMRRHAQWFIEQHEAARLKFHRYLHVGQ